jgi:hypothetical protein
MDIHRGMIRTKGRFILMLALTSVAEKSLCSKEFENNIAPFFDHRITLHQQGKARQRLTMKQWRGRDSQLLQW